MYPLDRLIRESDVIVTVKSVDVRQSNRRKQFLGRDVEYKDFEMECKTMRKFFPTEGELTVPFVACTSMEDCGDCPLPFKANHAYLLFLKKGTDKFYPLQLFEGIAPMEHGRTDFYFGSLRTEDAEQFIELYLSSTTSTLAWKVLTQKMIAANNLNNAHETAGLFEALALLPNQTEFEDYYMQGLSSSRGEVVENAMRRLISVGSVKGLEAIIKFYFELKATNGWENYKDLYVLPNHIGQFFRDAKDERLRTRLRQLRNEYPQEKELFDRLDTTWQP